jgi:hypothetical protein
MKRFDDIPDEFSLFPFGKQTPSDPTRHVTLSRPLGRKHAKERKGHRLLDDNRHSLITEWPQGGRRFRQIP